MSKLIDALNEVENLKITDNGALAHKSTLNAVYDFFALGAAMRRNVSGAVDLFAKAWAENPELAIKALFYVRNVRGGQGERAIFRNCYVWLLDNVTTHQTAIKRLVNLIPSFGRWDDLFYILDAQKDRDFEAIVYNTLIANQLKTDLKSEHPSLIGKWMYSINASSLISKRLGKKAAKLLNLSSAEYRKMLSILRKKIKIVESQMSANDWNAIEFENLPSGASLKYSRTFLRREETKDRYEEYINSKETKINAATLYPYDIVRKVIQADDWKEKAALDKMWEALPDYFDGVEKNILPVVDVSGSMYGGYGTVDPIYVALSLGIYTAQRCKGEFYNHFITFSERPQLVKLQGDNIAAIVNNMEKADWGYNTNLLAVFNLILKQAKAKRLSQEDLPETVVIISDMHIDAGNDYHNVKTDMETVHEAFEQLGYKTPHLVYWNVNAAIPTILDNSDNVTCVSGCSPILFKAVCTGKTGKDLMLEVLNSEEYNKITLK